MVYDVINVNYAYSCVGFLTTGHLFSSRIQRVGTCLSVCCFDIDYFWFPRLLLSRHKIWQAVALFGAALAFCVSVSYSLSNVSFPKFFAFETVVSAFASVTSRRYVYMLRTVLLCVHFVFGRAFAHCIDKRMNGGNIAAEGLRVSALRRGTNLHQDRAEVFA